MKVFDESGMLMPVKDDSVYCPYCSSSRLLKLTPRTTAEKLPIHCRKCKRDFLLSISRGQSPRGQSPGNP